MDQYKAAIRYGLIWGAISITTTLLLYLLGMMDNIAAGILLFVFGIYMMYRTGAEKRDELGGFISWKEALSPTWLVAVISTFLTTIFNWVLFNLIDPSLQQKQREQAIQMTEKMRSWIGDAETEKQLEELEKKDFASIQNFIMYFFIGILLYFVIAAIISAILKRKKAEDIFSKY
jgi:flagellar biosynthesis/type III secretory pathway M-ring protein FliF/YscJ